jgi:hypothetical protein
MTVKIKYGRNGAVKSIKGNIGRTRMNLAALELWKGNVEPTTGYKLRRFFKRMFSELSNRAEMASRYHAAPHAATVPVIRLENLCANVVGTPAACPEERK